jgi:photosystem II stability/assembly factor-like uncharacterized protein
MSRDKKPGNTPPANSDIFQIMADAAGRLWLASSVGLFQKWQGGWREASTAEWAAGAAIHVSEKHILAAGMNGGICRTSDKGRTWQVCHVDQTQKPVLCFAASPRLSQDGVYLAGTAGDGILRCRDGGASWQLENFGLRDFNIFTLLTAGVWERREMAFAGTMNGVYYSPNGGRAWKFCGLEGLAALCLAGKPDANLQGELWAGTDAGGLYRSQDFGRNWESVPLGMKGQVTVNAICYAGKTMLSATAENGILRSVDGGKSWQAGHNSPESTLSLEYAGGEVYAGSAGEGLWLSSDEGETWRQVL